MLFGTSGIRGDAEKLFTNQFCFDIGRTFAIFLRRHNLKGNIAIGMDPRKSNQRVKENIIGGLLYEGIEDVDWFKVLDEGITPSPAMNYILITDHSISGSIMITGSHIRTDFTGVKFFMGSGEILKEHEKEIENIYSEISGKVENGECVIYVACDYDSAIREGLVCVENRASDLYQNMLLGLTGKYPSWKIVLDLGNGCQSGIMPELMRKLGLNVTVINDDPQPDKLIARDTEVKEAVDEIAAKVKEICADFGMAYDGDGDRVVFVDEDGRFITGDYCGSLIAKYGDTPVVITPVNASQVVEHIGKSVVRTKVGSPNVIQAMKEYGATFGFEANGGGISKEIMLSRDAGSATIKIMNILGKNNMTLKELVNTLPQFFVYRTKIECPMNMYTEILNSVKIKYLDSDVRIENIDGLKIWTNKNTWILFRPSYNAPEFRVFAEATTEADAVKIGIEGINFVANVILEENLN